MLFQQKNEEITTTKNHQLGNRFVPLNINHLDYKLPEVEETKKVIQVPVTKVMGFMVILHGKQIQRTWWCTPLRHDWLEHKS